MTVKRDVQIRSPLEAPKTLVDYSDAASGRKERILLDSVFNRNQVLKV